MQSHATMRVVIHSGLLRECGSCGGNSGSGGIAGSGFRKPQVGGSIDTADRHYLGTKKLVVPKPGEWLSNVSRLFLVRSLSRPLGEVFQGDRMV